MAAAAAVNHGQGLLRLPETSSRCVTEGVIHDFEVNNYPLLEGIGVGRYITSSTFSAGGYDWNIRFYPDGHSKDSDHALAFLFYLSLAKDVRANITLTVPPEKEGQAQVNNTSVRARIFSPDSDHIGIEVQKSISRLDSGNLTIRCVVAVIKEPPTTSCKRDPVVAPPPPSKLPGHLERALENGRGADITLLVGGREFRAHRCILAARSPVFDDQLFGPSPTTVDKDTQNVQVDGMEPTIFKMLLHFVYTDSLPPPPCNREDYDVATMQHLLVAADRYALDGLKVMCEERLRNSIDVKTVMSTLALANQHCCERLKDACVEFMSTPGVIGVVLLAEGFIKRLIVSCTPLALEKDRKDKDEPAAKKLDNKG